MRKIIGSLYYRTAYLATHTVYLLSVLFIILPVVFLLWPFVKLKLAPIDGTRIGPYITNSNAIIRKASSNNTDRKILHIGLVDRVINKSVHKVVSRYLTIIPSYFFTHCIRRVLIVFPLIQRLPCFFSTSTFRDPAVFNTQKSPIELTADEDEKGQAELLEMGIEKDDWYICFHHRESAYLDQTYPDRDWKYHDYRDGALLPNLKAAREAVDRGGWALRMGSHIDEKIEVGENPKIVDYAAGNRSDFMDMYLGSKCRFFIVGGGSGIGGLSIMFNVPCVWTNIIPMCSIPWRLGDIFIPKLLWNKNKNRLITFPEMYEHGLMTSAQGGYSNFYLKNDLLPVENDDDDIADASSEMFDILEGKSPAEDGANLQSEFKKRFLGDIEHINMCANISSKFILKHKHLMN